MKKKTGILLLVGVFVVVMTILSIPKKYNLKDGGTVVYEAVTWRYAKYNSMYPDDKILVGEKLTIFGITFKDTTKEVEREKPDENAISGLTDVECAFGSYNSGYYD